MLVKVQIPADPTINIHPSAGGDDGYVYGNDPTDYNSAWSTGDAADDAGKYLFVGQYHSYIGTVTKPGGYTVYRSFLKFDTSVIPTDATITDAKLKLYGDGNYSDTDFYIRIQKWTGDTPIDTGDFTAYDGINYDDGTYNTSNFIKDDYNTINISNFDIITKGGYTKICLRSSRDISKTAPSLNTNEYVGFYTTEWGSGYWPLLEITYTTPAPPTPPKHPTTHLDKGPHPRSRMTFYPRLGL